MSNDPDILPEPSMQRSMWRHLNKVRWLVLIIVFLMLIVLPLLHVYQTYVAAHAYDLLQPEQKQLYDAMETVTKPFVNDPQQDLDAVKGTTWSGKLFGLRLSDPLAVLGQISASGQWYWPFIVTALIPIGLTLLFGRFFCGWICPATLVYELNTNLGTFLHRVGIHFGHRHLNPNLKYIVLAVGILLSALSGTVLFAAIYPPAIIGREIYYAIALGGFGAGLVFFILTLLFDLLVSRRGFCRYLCPGGALYSLLGRFRPLRIARKVAQCNDCAKCNAVCEFGLDPLHDNFGQECNNCSACIAICPTDALVFTVRIKDSDFLGPGHLGKAYKRKTSTSAGRRNEAS